MCLVIFNLHFNYHNMERKELSDKIRSIAPYFEMLPGVYIIHQLNPFTPCYMTQNGLELLGISLEELKEIGTDYHKLFFNNDEMEDYLQKMENLLVNADANESFTFFQQVKLKASEQWVWHLASTKIFEKDEKGNPTHVITVALPIDQLKHIPNKAERLLAEKNFFHINLNKFLTLGKREREVLKLVSLGKSSPEIASEMCISVQTVNTHRKVIKQKLDINSGYDFTLYAHAYDLI